ncbi:MAG: hypothetical protein AMXMBFR78_14570 [Rubrivivax sp.]
MPAAGKVEAAKPGITASASAIQAAAAYSSAAIVAGRSVAMKPRDGGRSIPMARAGSRWASAAP